ncbi:MAG: hypothetical protein JSW26_17470 [Desulfobacterales bacterium]|nr:MAG: hypothetical protein JSW26_17470 [Desulfobacterales bacterium]
MFSKKQNNIHSQMNNRYSRQINIPNTPAFSNAIMDMERAISEIHEDDHSIDDFEISFIEELPIADAVNGAGAYIPFIEPGSLVGLPDEKIETVLLGKGKSVEWCKLALQWKNGVFPAIVFVSMVQKHDKIEYQLGDGHNRLA